MLHVVQKVMELLHVLLGTELHSISELQRHCSIGYDALLALHIL